MRAVVAGPGGQVMSKSYGFQACLGPTVKQADVMPLCGIPSLLDAALAGFHVTVLAYGQTGSGKTFTMSGREEVLGGRGYAGGHAEDGIVTRAVHYLYRKKRDLGDSRCSFSASYLEIYNEQVFDLLAGENAAGEGAFSSAGSPRDKRPLPLRWDAHLGFHVPGLRVVPCPTHEDALAVLSQGMRSRHVASHELNQDSSRSHSMTTLHVWTSAADGASGRDASAGGGGSSTRRMGKVTFVDLAGSERLKISRTVDGKETGSINRSLFALGKVIAALAENAAGGGGPPGSGAPTHIPYRDSALTKLLTDSLGGSSLALMIACCSPSLRHLEETLSTLNYATRAKNIQNRPAVKMDAQQQLVACLRQEIDMLRSENAYFRQQLGIGVNSRPLASQPSAPAAMPTSAPSRLHSGARGASPRDGRAGTRLAPLGGGEGGAARGRHGSPPGSGHGTVRASGSRGGPVGRGGSRLAAGPGGPRRERSGGSSAGSSRGSSPRGGGVSAQDFENLVQKNQELTVSKNLLELELRDADAKNSRLEAKLAHLEAVFTSSQGNLLLEEAEETDVRPFMESQAPSELANRAQYTARGEDGGGGGDCGSGGGGGNSDGKRGGGLVLGARRRLQMPVSAQSSTPESAGAQVAGDGRQGEQRVPPLIGLADTSDRSLAPPAPENVPAYSGTSTEFEKNAALQPSPPGGAARAQQSPSADSPGRAGAAPPPAEEGVIKVSQGMRALLGLG